MTPVKYLNSLGIFDTPSTAAHCVWIEEDDRDILEEKGVSVCVNPISNLKLASGVCDIPKLLDKGINVTIGTDSAASNNCLDFMEEIKIGGKRESTLRLPNKVQYRNNKKITLAMQKSLGRVR